MATMVPSVSSAASTSGSITRITSLGRRSTAKSSAATTTTASVQTITVPEELEGNGYVTVSFIRGLDSPEKPNLA